MSLKSCITYAVLLSILAFWLNGWNFERGPEAVKCLVVCIISSVISTIYWVIFKSYFDYDK